ncbi:hypothetical protein [Dipodfec virus RodF1_74]|uniref:Uncharacterized protein n=1 Tax=Dipodfec virus RodF1_74 TaxID=2929310 RepID=A0A976N297_9VIRU|nr:hypothetical protein [Dipodfec virus RodF1_74]
MRSNMKNWRRLSKRLLKRVYGGRGRKGRFRRRRRR